MKNEQTSTADAKAEYEKPEVRDYGHLKELTASSVKGGITDVPKGFPVALS